MAARKRGRPAGGLVRRTSVLRFEKKSATLRTIVPRVIAETLGIESGD